jgi:hypothetical protein
MIGRLKRVATAVPMLLVLACAAAAGALQPAGSAGRGAAALALVLFAVATHRLAGVWTGGPWTAVPAGLLASAGPLAVALGAGVPLVGPAAFLLPLGCYLAEKSLLTGAPGFALAAGACALAPAALEPAAAVPIGAGIVGFVALRVLLCRTVEIPVPRAGARSFALAAACVCAGGVAAAVGGGSPAWFPAVVAAWFALAALCRRFSLLSFAAARDGVGPLFFALAPLAALRVFDARGAWAAVVALCVAVPVAGALWLIVRSRDPLPMLNWPASLPALLASGVGAALAALLERPGPDLSCQCERALAGGFAGSFAGGCAGPALPLGAVLVLLPAVAGWIALTRPDPPADAGRRAVAGALAFGSAALSGGAFLLLPVVFGALLASLGLGGLVRRAARAAGGGAE